MGEAESVKVPIYRERDQTSKELFQKVTHMLGEKDRLIAAQSAEIISKACEIDRKDARIAALLDICPVGVIFICNRIIEYINKRITAITGYEKEELEGKNSRILYASAEEWDAVGVIQANAKRTAETCVHFKRKDGTIVACNLQMTRVVDEYDQEFIVLVYTEDV